MPHVTLVPLTGFRLRESEMLALGMSLPGLGPRANAVGQLPALGLLTLAGALPPHWSCDYRPAEAVSNELLHELLTRKPDLVAISALTASIAEAYVLARRLRAEGVPTVLGGLHASACPEEAVKHVDAVVVGPAEGVWHKILDDAEHRCLQPRYGAIDSIGAHDEAGAWPTPRFELLGDHPHRFTLQTQRGCPFACDFCGASRLLGRFVEKPASRIRDELARIRTMRPRPLIELADDNTFAGTRSADELLSVLQDSRARWFTEADWRIGERTDIVSRLADAGCVQVLMGMESLVFRYPGMGQKQAELNRMMEAANVLQEAGVAVNACFIVGADGETRASMDRLVEFLATSPFAEVQLTLQTPFPGTGLHRRLAREGRLLPNRDWSFHTLFDVTYQPDLLTVSELERGFRNVVSQVFSDAACQRRDAIRERVWRLRYSEGTIA